ncbi:MAG: [Fe-Fe] hydrogenase large subunit C-terminal domain-containing protein [Bacteroidota bacterium]
MKGTEDTYTHAIRVDTNTCIGCSHCMRVCPTQAIRIVDGHAEIQARRCVDCGECFRVCPVSAIYVKADELDMINGFDVRVALIPSVFIGQFPAKCTTTDIINAIHQLGFHHVFEVEHAADYIKKRYQEHSQQARQKPAISSYCPAVVRLIQVMFPSLTSNILQIKAPHDLAALYYRDLLRENMDKETGKVGVFYFTPCASKIVAAKEPVGEEESCIDGALSMEYMYNAVFRILMDIDESECLIDKVDMSSDAVKWSLNGTEKKYYPGRGLSIDGMSNNIEFLEKLESGEISDVDFLELRACDQGCAGGILCPANRFLTVERLDSRREYFDRMAAKDRISNPVLEKAEFLSDKDGTERVLPRSGMALDEDLDKAMHKMDKMEKMLAYLPGFDCGACGAPTCKALAEDIASDKASLSHCVFVQRVMEKNYKLSPDQAFLIIEKIWGKNRLEKYKHEGKDESQKTD